MKQIDKGLIQFRERLALMLLRPVENGRLSRDEVMQLGKRNQIRRDLVQIHVEGSWNKGNVSNGIYWLTNDSLDFQISIKFITRTYNSYSLSP